jgi:hypothetical protein
MTGPHGSQPPVQERALNRLSAHGILPRHDGVEGLLALDP